MNLRWEQSHWHLGPQFQFSVQLPVMAFSDSPAPFTSLRQTQPFVDSFCQPQFNGTWASITNELGALTPCFIDIVILGSAHLVLILMGIARLRAIVKATHVQQLPQWARRLQLGAALLSILCAVIPLMQLSARASLSAVGADSVPPFEVPTHTWTSHPWLIYTQPVIKSSQS